VISPYAAYPIWNQTPGWFALGIQSSPESQQAAAKIISDSGAKSLAAVVCAEVAACGAVDAVLSKSAPADGLRYDGVLKVAASSPSYTAQCLALKGKETQVLYMGVSSGVSLKLASDCATQDYTPEFFFPYHAFQPALTKIQGLNALAMLPTLPWYADVPATKDFRSAMSQYADLSKADETSMYAWVGLEAFRAAAAKAGATPTKQSVMAAMYQLKDYNAGGLIAPVSFTQGQPSPYVKCYFVAGYSDGKFTTPQGTDPKCLS
jgi:branched-chain amino acid transport system substrate-binding protein